MKGIINIILREMCMLCTVSILHEKHLILKYSCCVFPYTDTVLNRKHQRKNGLVIKTPWAQINKALSLIFNTYLNKPLINNSYNVLKIIA